MRVVTNSPTSEPVTLAEARLQCRVDHTAEDTAIEGRLIPAARFAAETYLGRALISRSVVVKMDCWEADADGAIVLPIAPVVSVASVAYRDSNGDTQTLSTSVYETSLGGKRPGRVRLKPGNVWPVLYGGTDDVTITFVAGYGTVDDVPAMFKQAILIGVEDLFEHRGSFVTGTIVADLPTAAMKLLAPHRSRGALVPSGCSK